jgi:hypothetical protein
MEQFRWFWAWEDEKEEAWLREQAQKGWHLRTVSFPGFYVFESGEPRDDVYRLDYFMDKKEMPSYLQLFKDAGWEHVGQMNNWQYFRKTAVGGETPEIFSDNESKAKKYQRILVILVVFSPIYANFIRITNQASGTFFEIFTFLMFLLFLFYLYAVLKLIQRVSQLRKSRL